MTKQAFHDQRVFIEKKVSDEKKLLAPRWTTGHVLGAAKNRSDLFGRALWLIVVSTIVLLPLTWSVLAGAEFISFASESLAYRYFYSIRLHVGPDTTAWLPQGQLISSTQHLITWLLPGLAPQSFRTTVNAFSMWSMAAVSLVAIGGLSIASLASAVTWRDRCLLTIVALVPIYALPGAILWIWPDYYALDIALAVLAVAAFQYEWRGNEATAMKTCMLYGILAGSIAANKISMVAVAFPLIALALVKRATPAGLVTKAALIAGTAALTFMLWFLAAGQFQIQWLAEVLPRWFAFISNPGGDAGFNVIPYLLTSYGITVLWLAAASGTVAATTRELRGAAVGAIALAAALLCVLSIWKRPAGTTVGDSAIIFLALGAMLFCISGRSRVLGASIALGAAAFVFAALYSGHLFTVRNLIVSSKTAGAEQWAFFDKARTQANGRRMFYFIPDNNYQYGDVFIVALKGTSDFPSWYMARTGPALLSRVDLNVTFVSEYSFPSGWNEPVPGGSLLVWMDAPGLRRPVEDHYPFLTEARARPGAVDEVTDLPVSGATAHIVQLP
jgi:hypothetical protein